MLRLAPVRATVRATAIRANMVTTVAAACGDAFAKCTEHPKLYVTFLHRNRYTKFLINQQYLCV